MITRNNYTELEDYPEDLLSNDLDYDNNQVIDGIKKCDRCGGLLTKKDFVRYTDRCEDCIQEENIGLDEQKDFDDPEELFFD